MNVKKKKKKKPPTNRTEIKTKSQNATLHRVWIATHPIQKRRIFRIDCLKNKNNNQVAPINAKLPPWKPKHLKRL